MAPAVAGFASSLTSARLQAPLVAMIARTWTAHASRPGTDAYVEFFRLTLTPQLASLEGHRGAVVLRSPVADDDVHITVITFWESMTAVARFAGSSPDVAVVEPEARALLTSFDARVQHHEVAFARIEGMAGVGGSGEGVRSDQ